MTRYYRVLSSIIVFTMMGIGSFVLSKSFAEDEQNRKGQPIKSREQQESKASNNDLAKFMRGKLDASSQILDGLCTEDFRKIISGASKLQELSAAESWRVSTDVMYRQHSAELRGAVKDLLNAASKKNLDGAALAWTRTTLSCIECHKWVRATLISKG
ncbi:hypothetical protein [Thalassoroseus pseudoceratinae]|uniref:hypothetical protein n=1 Tax=Thalassoroseus pseudoceratinae TaxID=2713176 RepID=UPI00142109A5|nr:hypothetical protein [Thalassoroseus pseudoceratinae]